MVQIDIESHQRLRNSLQTRPLKQLVKSAAAAAANDLQIAISVSRGGLESVDPQTAKANAYIMKMINSARKKMGSQFGLTADDQEKTHVSKENMRQYLWEFCRSYREVFFQAMILSKINPAQSYIEAAGDMCSSMMRVREDLRNIGNLLHEAEWVPRGLAQPGIPKYAVQSAAEILTTGSFPQLPRYLELAAAQATFEADPLRVFAMETLPSGLSEVLDDGQQRTAIQTKLSHQWRYRWSVAPVRHDRASFEAVDGVRLRLTLFDEVELLLVDDFSGIQIFGATSKLPEVCGHNFDGGQVRGLINALGGVIAIYGSATRIQQLTLRSKTMQAQRALDLIDARIGVILGTPQNVIDNLKLQSDPSLFESAEEDELPVLREERQRLRRTVRILKRCEHEAAFGYLGNRYANLYWAAKAITGKVIFNSWIEQAAAAARLVGYPGGVWLSKSQLVASAVNEVSVITQLEASLNEWCFDHEGKRLSLQDVEMSRGRKELAISLLVELDAFMSRSGTSTFDVLEPNKKRSPSDVPIVCLPFTADMKSHASQKYSRSLVHSLKAAMEEEGTPSPDDPLFADVYNTIENMRSPALVLLDVLNKYQSMKIVRATVGLLPLLTLRTALGGRLDCPSIRIPEEQLFESITDTRLFPTGRFGSAEKNVQRYRTNGGFVIEAFFISSTGDTFALIEPIAGWMRGLKHDTWSPASHPVLWQILLHCLDGRSPYHILIAHSRVTGYGELAYSEIGLIRGFQATLYVWTKVATQVASSIVVKCLSLELQRAQRMATIGPMDQNDRLAKLFAATFDMDGAVETNIRIVNDEDVSMGDDHNDAVEHFADGPSAWRWMMGTDGPFSRHGLSYDVAKERWERQSTHPQSLERLQLQIECRGRVRESWVSITLSVTLELEGFGGGTAAHIKLTQDSGMDEDSRRLGVDLEIRLSTDKPVIPALIIRKWLAALRLSPLEALTIGLPEMAAALERAVTATIGGSGATPGPVSRAIARGAIPSPLLKQQPAEGLADEELSQFPVNENVEVEVREATTFVKQFIGEFTVHSQTLSRQAADLSKSFGEHSTALEEFARDRLLGLIDSVAMWNKAES